MHNACMTVLTIRNVPDELNARLKARAQEHGQSVQQFLLRGLWRLAEESPLEQRLHEALMQAPIVDIPVEEIDASWSEYRRHRDA